jgi:beta-glucanase (GH16 family)
MKFPDIIRRSTFLGCFLFALAASAQSNTGWTLIWSDEFSQPDGSSPDSSKWAYDIGTGSGGWGNNELEYYTSRTNNARIENGQLVIEARQESFSGSSYTSARLKTQGKISWQYGRIEARLKIPRGQGIWPAFWTLGTNITVGSVGWPRCGEIDIMENIGKEPTLVHGTIHGPGYSGGSAIGGPYSLPGNATFADDFHIYAIEWTTNQIKWFVDGVQYFGVNPVSLPAATNWVFTNSQFILLNVAVGGIWPGNPDGTTTFPQRMTVDYVRIYAPTNLGVCCVNAVTNSGFESGGLANWMGGAGNALLENIHNVPVHDGTNVFKVYGQFSGLDNFSGVYQDIPTTAGQAFTASGWAITPSNDQIGGANTAWIEVDFRNASSNITMYRSGMISNSTPPGAWLKLPVTNQFFSGSSTVIGGFSNLVAPANTTFARYRLVFHQPATAGGAVLFDDLKLSPAGPAEAGVPLSFSRSGSNINLAFGTYLNWPYVVGWKADLGLPGWLALTNFSGDGTVKNIAVGTQSDSGFYRVVRLCD